MDTGTLIALIGLVVTVCGTVIGAVLKMTNKVTASVTRMETQLSSLTGLPDRMTRVEVKVETMASLFSVPVPHVIKSST